MCYWTKLLQIEKGAIKKGYLPDIQRRIERSLIKINGGNRRHAKKKMGCTKDQLLT